MEARRCRVRATAGRLRRMSWPRCPPWEAWLPRTMTCGASLPSFARNTTDHQSVSLAVRNRGTPDPERPITYGRQVDLMTTQFRVGDHVRWNSEAGYVTGTIIKVHTTDTEYKGYTHHASREAPQYEIQSDLSTHVAMHKGTALRKISG